MNFSAALSRSPVVTPARAFPRSSVRVRARTRPAAAIFSISSGVFWTITLESVACKKLGPLLLKLVFQAQRGERGTDVIVHLARRALAVEGPQQVALLVVLHERAGLVVVDLEPVLDGLGLVVLALLEPGAVLVADALVLRRVELDVVEVAVLDAHAAAGEAPDHLVVVHVHEQRRGEPAAAPVESLLEDVGLLDGAGEAVEQEAVGRLGL